MESNQPKKDESFQFFFEKSKKNSKSLKNYVQLIYKILKDYNNIFSEYKSISNDYIKKLNNLSSKYTGYISSYEKELINQEDKYKDLLKLIQRIPEIFNLQITKLKSIQVVSDECCEDNNELQKNNKQYEELQKEFDSKEKNMNKIFSDLEYNKKNLFDTYRNVEDTLKNTILETDEKVRKINEIIIMNSQNINEKEQLYSKSNKDLNKHQKDYFTCYDKLISFSENIFKSSLDALKSKITSFVSIFFNISKNEYNSSEQLIKNISEIDTKIDYSSILSDLTEKINCNFTIDKYVPNIINNNYIEDKNKKYNHIKLQKENNYFIKDNTIYLRKEDVYEIMKNMYGQFQFVDEKYFNLAKEKKKIQIKNLTDKLLSFGIKSNIFSFNEITPIKDKEVNLLISSLDKPEYRFDFLKVFNLFRTKGLCEFPQREFEFTKKIFLFIAEKIKEETDVLSSKLILILAQTFYTKENDEKIYLFKYLKNHEMFLNLEVWDKYLASSIEDDLTRAKVDVSNINLEVNDSNKSVVINNVLIAHLFSFCHNMIEFGMKIENIKKIIDPVIKKYNLTEDSINQINGLIENELNGQIKEDS